MQLSLTRQQLVKIRIRFSKRHVYLIELAEHIHDWLHAFLHALANGLCRVKLWVLLQISDRVPRRENNLTLIVLLDACDDFQQRGFACTVQTDDAYLGTIEETEVDVVQHLFLRREALAHAHHRKDDFLVVCHKNLIKNLCKGNTFF